MIIQKKKKYIHKNKYYVNYSYNFNYDKLIYGGSVLEVKINFEE